MKSQTLSCLICSMVVAIGATRGIGGSATKPPIKSGWATWYSRESCRREGTGGDRVLMANGKPLDDAAMTCALWLTNSTGRPLRPDGRIVTVRTVIAPGTTPNGNHGTLRVAWTDNGPGSVPRSRGVIVDLSRAAMLALAGPEGIRAGRVRVEVEVIR